MPPSTHPHHAPPPGAPPPPASRIARRSSPWPGGPPRKPRASRRRNAGATTVDRPQARSAGSGSLPPPARPAAPPVGTAPPDPARRELRRIPPCRLLDARGIGIARHDSRSSVVRSRHRRPSRRGWASPVRQTTRRRADANTRATRQQPLPRPRPRRRWWLRDHDRRGPEAGALPQPRSRHPNRCSWQVLPTHRRAEDASGRAPSRGPAAPNPVLAPAPSVEMPTAQIGPLSLRHAAANGDPAPNSKSPPGLPRPRAYRRISPRPRHGISGPRCPGPRHRAVSARHALYERGLGVAADQGRARVWYGRAAEQGNVRAMHNLAVFSASRPGASPDYPSAVQWFTEAANRGLADSQYNLGVLYETGKGVPASAVEAYKWYALAARGGDKDAIRPARRPAQQARTRRASAPWTPSSSNGAPGRSIRPPMTSAAPYPPPKPCAS